MRKALAAVVVGTLLVLAGPIAGATTLKGLDPGHPPPIHLTKQETAKLRQWAKDNKPRIVALASTSGHLADLLSPCSSKTIRCTTPTTTPGTWRSNVLTVCGQLKGDLHDAQKAPSPPVYVARVFWASALKNDRRICPAVGQAIAEYRSGNGGRQAAERAIEALDTGGTSLAKIGKLATGKGL
jgi:hypothetical protein